MLNNKRILVIGAGGVASAYLRKLAKYIQEGATVALASRRLESCHKLAATCENLSIECFECDADEVDQVSRVIRKSQADLVVNLALPYQDLSIMKACIENKVSYIDTANYEPKNEAKFCYKWQWDLHEDFKSAGIMALLGAGFDPGVTNVFTAYARKHLFDVIDTLDILDCNGGDHGQAFATNFNPEINIREITQQGKYYQDGEWLRTKPLSQFRDFDFPEVGMRRAYLMYHEELESLVKHFPEIKEARFWMTFSESYLTHLEVLQNVGLTGIEPISFQGQEIVPLQFLKACLPKPSDLAAGYTGKTSIGNLIAGKKDGKEKALFIYNCCDHRACYLDVQSQAVSFTTAIPALIATKLLCDGTWQGKGVFNIETLNPDPFMELLPLYGLPWQVKKIAHA